MSILSNNYNATLPFGHVIFILPTASALPERVNFNGKQSKISRHSLTSPVSFHRLIMINIYGSKIATVIILFNPFFEIFLVQFMQIF